MVNEQRLHSMIKIAKFDANDGKRCKPMIQYARKDYVALQLSLIHILARSQSVYFIAFAAENRILEWRKQWKVLQDMWNTLYIGMRIMDIPC